jgi:Zn-dependent protease
MDGRFDIHFRAGPLPVVIEPSFWIGALMLGSGLGASPRLLIWVLVVLASVLVHEFGHAAAGLAFGVRSRIRLHLFGGLTLPERALPRWHDVLMSLAGPCAGFAFAGLIWLTGRAFAIWEREPLWQSAYEDGVWVNVAWGVLNLLPVLPLDGGHVLFGVLGPRRHRWVLGIGGAVAASIALAAGALRHDYYLAVLLGLFAFRNFQALFAADKAPRGPAEAITLDQALARGWAALSGGQLDDADRLGRMVLEHASEPGDRNRARDLLAWAALASANSRGALQQLERTEPPEAARALTWAMVLDAIEERSRALPYALRALETEPSETAANLAIRLHAMTGGWEKAMALAHSFAWQRPGSRDASLGEAAFSRGAFTTAAEHYAAAFAATGQPGEAYNAACSHARSGNRGDAHAWLRRAVGAGLKDPDQILADPDLASLKGDPELDALFRQSPELDTP